MFPLLACLALAADPAADWQKAEAEHLATSNNSPRISSAPAKATSRPTARRSSSRPRRKKTAIRSTRSSPWTWRRRTTRVSPGVGKTTCSFFRPTARRSSSPAAISIPTPRTALGRRIQTARGRQKGRQTPPLQLGLRSAHADLRGQPRRHRPQAADRRRKATTPRAVTRPTASRSSSAPTSGNADNLELYIMDATATTSAS